MKPLSARHGDLKRVPDPLSHQGIDEDGATTVQTTATSSLITDLAGNTLELIFKKLKQEGKEIKMQIQELRYNGVSTGGISKIALQYEWSTNKLGNLKELEEKLTVGLLKVEGHYDAKKNMTKIKKKLKEKDGDDIDGGDDKEETKESLLGLVIINLTTDKGKVGMSY